MSTVDDSMVIADLLQSVRIGVRGQVTRDWMSRAGVGTRTQFSTDHGVGHTKIRDVRDQWVPRRDDRIRE